MRPLMLNRTLLTVSRSWMAHRQEVQSYSWYRQEISVTDPVSTGETIPIRLFLGGFDLTPTFREVNKKYSTRYYLSLVLIDEGPYLFLLILGVGEPTLIHWLPTDARRYFKQSEIVLYRQAPEIAAAQLHQAQSHPQQITGAAG